MQWIRVQTAGSSARRSIWRITLVAALIALGLAPSGNAAFQGGNGKIAFRHYTHSNNFRPVEIFTMRADGSGLARLPGMLENDSVPEWSADGKKLAFSCDGGICTMNAKGTERIQITNEPSAATPSWSPDGTRIVFESSRYGKHDLFTVNADGTGTRRLSNDTTDDVYPVWSPNGSKIAFLHGGSYGNVTTMNPDGSELKELTSAQAARSLDWSPDGKRIAFERFSDIHVINVDGTGLVNLTPGQPDIIDNDGWPAWSPDGRKIAFYGFHLGYYGQPNIHDIYTMNADGSEQTRISRLDGFNSNPEWQPLIVNRPPNCGGVTASPAALSSLDRALHLVRLSGATDPDGDPVALRATGVTQDERVGSRTETSPDARLGPAPNQVRVRAERKATGDGRIYRITYIAADGKGSTCSGTVKVRLSARATAVDSAPPSYDSLVAPLATHVSCGDVVTRNLKLANDLVECPGTGIVVDADDVVIDLNGHMIDGVANHEAPPGEYSAGVFLSGKNIRVENGTIRQFHVGVEASNGNGLRELKVRDVPEVGIRAGYSDVIRRNELSNTADGVRLAGGSNRVEGNVLHDNKNGITTEEGGGGEIFGNSVVESAEIGIHIREGRGEIYANRVADSGLAGIAATTSAASSVIRGNRVARSGRGIFLEGGSWRNLIARNVLIDNSVGGIVVDAAQDNDNRIVENRVLRNGDGIFLGGTYGADHEVGNTVDRNVAAANADDGIDTENPFTMLRGNSADRNGDLGIEAVEGVTDGGGNRAFGNGNPLQCINVDCG